MDYKKKYKESEDERIRKRLIDIINGALGVKPIESEQKELIAWVEKQGKLVNEYEDRLDRCACECFNKGYKAAIEHQKEKQGEQEEPQVYETKEGEIITYSKTDGYKVLEPKFHEGEWIIQKNIGVYKIIEVCETWYEVVDNKDNHYSIGFDKEYMCRPWTIQDAKDGDVLASGGVVFVFKVIHGVWLNCHYSAHKDGSFNADSYDLLTNKYFGEVYPATKEQRDLLFAKMKEAGYEWDAEKKELRNK